MTDYDFTTCKFIARKMSFISFFDFCDKCDTIKQMYVSFSENEKLFYRWYVYANIHMAEYHKNAIWDFLNSDEPEYKMNMFKLKRTYHMK